MSQSNTFILGSGSPRRKDLLGEAGYQFTIEPSTAEELHDSDLDVRELTKWNAKLKAEEVASRFPDQIVLGADTLVTIDGQALGKPNTREEALKMIRTLNGRTHQVMTGVCLMRKTPSLLIQHCEVTDVSFKSLSDDELKNYHNLIDPMDKAGAYAAQEHGGVIIEKTNGSWTNVVGLPMEAVKTMLEKLSIYPDPALT
ncbi:MAG: septum formation protein Maf [Verrucomicrobia bacterium]|nr:septum formation protein Maf [Verrucomicrobiota bacterium]